MTIKLCHLLPFTDSNHCSFGLVLMPSWSSDFTSTCQFFQVLLSELNTQLQGMTHLQFLKHCTSIRTVSYLISTYGNYILVLENGSITVIIKIWKAIFYLIAMDISIISPFSHLPGKYENKLPFYTMCKREVSANRNEKENLKRKTKKWEHSEWWVK